MRYIVSQRVAVGVNLVLKHYEQREGKSKMVE